jgi:MFS family permease
VTPPIRRRYLADLSPLRESPGFRAQWFGQVGSALGRETAKYAVPIHIYLLTDSVGFLGLVAVVQLIATVFAAGAGGMISDLFDRRVVLLGSISTMAIATTALLALALTESTAVPLIVALGVLITVLPLVEHPSRMGAISRLVPEQRLPSAIALTTLNFQAMSIAGPAIGAVMFGLAGLAGAYLIQVVSFAWALIASLRMPSIPAAGRASQSPLRMIAAGLRFVAGRRIIVSTFAIDLTAMILAMPIGSLLPILLLEAYDLTPETVGFMMAARGIGAVAGAALSGWIRAMDYLGRALLAAVAIYAVATIFVGLAAGAVVLALPLMAIAGASDVTSAILRNTIIQTSTPDELRGRVTAIHMLSSNGGPRLGDIRAAAMAEALGPAAAIVWGGAAALAGFGAVVWAFPELMTQRRRTNASG